MLNLKKLAKKLYACSIGYIHCTQSQKQTEIHNIKNGRSKKAGLKIIKMPKVKRERPIILTLSGSNSIWNVCIPVRTSQTKVLCSLLVWLTTPTPRKHESFMKNILRAIERMKDMDGEAER
jgi:hypothetical protein